MKKRVQFNKEEFIKTKRETWNATNYGSWFMTERGKLIDFLEKKALKNALNGMLYENALDVGIGDGRLLDVYSPNVGKIVGLDISSTQLKLAKEKSKELKTILETRLCQDASNIDIEDKSFDLIICSRVLQHLYNWREAISEFGRILKLKGDLLLLTYNRFSIYGIKKLYQNKFVNPTKGRFCNPIDLIKELKKNGFRITYYSGALIGQPELFNKNLSRLSTRLIYSLEKYARLTPVKYLGGRQVVRAKKMRD